MMRASVGVRSRRGAAVLQSLERFPHLQVAARDAMGVPGLLVVVKCSKCSQSASIEVDDVSPVSGLGTLEAFCEKVAADHAHPTVEEVTLESLAAAKAQAERVAKLRELAPATHRAVVAAVAARLAGDVYADARDGKLGASEINHCNIGSTAVDIADAVLLAMSPADSEAAP